MTEALDPGAPRGAPFLTVSEIRKSFGGVQALKGVSLDLRAGEVHGLVGANGAGKSTMIRILAGLDRPDSGGIEIDGRPIVIENPHRATALGLGFIHQELALVPRMNALENIMLGAPKESRLGMLSWRAVAERVKPIAERAGIAFPLEFADLPAFDGRALAGVDLPRPGAGMPADRDGRADGLALGA